MVMVTDQIGSKASTSNFDVDECESENDSDTQTLPSSSLLSTLSSSP